MLKEKFETWLKVEKQYSPHTFKAYLGDLESLETFLIDQDGTLLFSENDVKKVHHRSIRGWMGMLLEKGNSHRSVARRLSSAKTYFSWLQKMGKLPRNPATRIKLPNLRKNFRLFCVKQKPNIFLMLFNFPRIGQEPETSVF